MKVRSSFCLFILFFIAPTLASPSDGPLYDHSAYTECKLQPEKPLYNGGVLKDLAPDSQWIHGGNKRNTFHTPAFVLQNLPSGTVYSVSSWVKIRGTNSALVRASLKTEESTHNCIGSVLAKRGCWSFLKGGFVLTSPSNLSELFFQNSDDRDIDIAIDSASLQPFTEEQWRLSQQHKINRERKRAATIHISNKGGGRLAGATVTVEQISKDFPFGSAISKSILGNLPYQGIYLEQVLREGFSHPAVNGIMLWSALDPKGCYQICLTDSDFNNLPVGDVVDKLLKEWETGVINGQSDEYGSYSFFGFLGEYKVTVEYEDKTVNSTFSLCQSDETRHLNIQL